MQCSYRKTRVQCSCCQECNVPACVLRGIECNARIERLECNARVVVRNAMFLRVFVNESSALVRIGELSEMLFFHLRVDTVLCFYFTSYLCVSANANGFLQLAPSERYSSSIFFVILMPACLRPRHKQRYSSSVFFTLILVCLRPRPWSVTVRAFVLHSYWCASAAAHGTLQFERFFLHSYWCASAAAQGALQFERFFLHSYWYASAAAQGALQFEPFFLHSYWCVFAPAHGALQFERLFYTHTGVPPPPPMERYSSSVFFTLILVCWGWLAGQNFPKKSEKCQKAKKHCFYKLKR